MKYQIDEKDIPKKKKIEHQEDGGCGCTYEYPCQTNAEAFNSCLDLIWSKLKPVQDLFKTELDKEKERHYHDKMAVIQEYQDLIERDYVKRTPTLSIAEKICTDEDFRQGYFKEMGYLTKSQVAKDYIHKDKIKLVRGEYIMKCRGSHDGNHKPIQKMGSKTGYICSCCCKEIDKTSKKEAK